MRQSFWLYAVALLSLIGVISVLIATTQGVGISPDSVAYIGAARNLLDGHGLSLPYGQTPGTPLTHFPPLYPVLLAASGLLGVELLQAARWLQAALFGVQIFLSGYLLHRYATSWLAIVCSTLVLASPSLLTLSIMAWTEALFLVLSLVAIWLLARFFERSEWLYLIASSLIVGAALLTRYSGIALVITGCLAVLLLSQASRQRRLFSFFCFAILSLLPLTLWMIRNMAVAGTATNREFSFHPLGRTHLLQTLDTISGWWMIPDTTPSIIKLVVVLISFLLLIATLFLQPVEADLSGLAREPRRVGKHFFTKILILYVFVYSSFLVLSLSFIDANTPLDGRILSPLYLVGLLLILYTAHQISDYLRHSRLFQMALGIIILLFVLLSGREATQMIVRHYQYGIGFASAAWQQSEIMDFAKQLPAEITVFSNAPEALYFLADKPALAIPKKLSAMTQKPNSNYADELETMKQMLEAEQAVLIYLANLGRASASQETELQMQLDLSVLFRTQDGSIYRVASAQEAATQ